jgi:hypothetical protein
MILICVVVLAMAEISLRLAGRFYLGEMYRQTTVASCGTTLSSAGWCSAGPVSSI